MRIVDCNKFITMCHLKICELKKNLDEIDELIERGAKLSDMPPDTSKLKDEFNLSYAEKREKVIDEINKNKSLINRYQKKVDFIKDTIDKLPDCSYKDILKDYFIEGKSIKSITYKNRCCRQTVYNLVYKINNGG